MKPTAPHTHTADPRSIRLELHAGRHTWLSVNFQCTGQSCAAEKTIAGSLEDWGRRIIEMPGITPAWEE